MPSLYPAVTPAPTTPLRALAGLSALWEQTKGDPRVTIAIVDGPIHRENASLAGALINQYDVIGQGLAEKSCTFHHGTEIASIIFAQPESATPGIAPRCRGLSVPVFECLPAASVAADQSDVARAIDLARELGAMVINISAGQKASGDGASVELLSAVQQCVKNGVLVVAAAGNDGCNCLHIPAALPSVLSVGAMTFGGRPLDTSNWGPVYQESGILAPGQGIPVATAGGGIALRTGTSYATAIVSGVVGLLLSRELHLGRPPDPFKIRDALLNSADGCSSADSDCRRFLVGRINISGAISYLDRWSTSMTDNSQFDAPNQATAESASTYSSVVSPIDEASQRDASGRHEASDSAMLRWQAEPSTGGFEPSTCAACRGERQLVYALGQLAYDFGSEANLDAFRQRMLHVLGKSHGEPNPSNERQLLRFFRETRKEPWHHTGLLWTLTQGGSAIYVLQPEGAFAARTYRRLLKFFKEQYRHRADRVAVPGVITGRKTLLNGMVVDVIDPDLRGLCNWNRKALVDALFSARGEEHELSDEHARGLDCFLDRIYYELQNTGLKPEHRALNYAGTNLFEISEVLSTLGDKRTLDTIHVEPSQICRRGSECWDIVLSFFNPDQLQPVSKIYRYTVDVSAVIPVTVGAIRSWEARSR